VQATDYQALLSCFTKNYHQKAIDQSGSSSAPPPPPPRVTFAVLEKQDAGTSSAIIAWFGDDKRFDVLSKFETKLIVGRDEEDAQKLESGIQISVSKGVISPMDQPPTYKQIDVFGKTPDQVCNVILKDLGSTASRGSVVVLCGLSGTGKGTTVAELKERLPNAITWSNGNVFRALTLLAVTWCKLFNVEGFDKDAALTASNLALFVKMLTFGQFNGQWDIKISGLGIDALVSEIKDTLLKSPEVAKNIPTVAEVVQGEVILFASAATQEMCSRGMNVILEGREATVNYVRTPYRYTLTLPDTQIIGKRRAAQRIAASTLASLKKAPSSPQSQNGETSRGPSASDTGNSPPSEDDVHGTLSETLNSMIEEMREQSSAAEFVAELEAHTASADEGTGEGDDGGDDDDDDDL